MEVHWQEQIEADVPADDDWLGASEVTFLGDLRFAKRRADWRLGRWTAKRALAIWLGVPSHPEVLAKIEIRPRHPVRQRFLSPTNQGPSRFR